MHECGTSQSRTSVLSRCDVSCEPHSTVQAGSLHLPLFYLALCPSLAELPRCFGPGARLAFHPPSRCDGIAVYRSRSVSASLNARSVFCSRLLPAAPAIALRLRAML